MRGMIGGVVGLGALVLACGAFEDGIMTFSEMLMLVAAPAAIEAWGKLKVANLEREAAREVAIIRYASEDEDE